MTISEIKPYPKNAKKHPDRQVEQIAASIKEFGFNQPIVVDKNNEIIVGHGRFLAAQKLGITEVPTIRLENLTEEQVKAYRLADNKLNESGWDMDKVIDELKVLNEKGFNIDLTGFEKDLILDSDQDDFNVESEYSGIGQPIVQLGDIWKLGDHRLICGDSTYHGVIAELMSGEKAKMIFTDPPYNVDYQGGMNESGQNVRMGILNDKMTGPEFYKFLVDSVKNMIDFTEGAVYICMGSSEIHTLRKAFEEAGGHWQAFIIWVKNHFTLSRTDYQHSYEPILYGWHSNIKNHYFLGDRNAPDVWEELQKVKTEFDGENTTIKFQGFEVKVKGKVEGQVKRKKQSVDVWRFNKPSKSAEHPTMKPIELCAEAVKNSSMKGDIVLDPFGGSGSTLIASEILGRKCYMSELDPKFCDVIIKRWEKLTGKKAEKVV